MKITVLIPAAGLGIRMGGAVRKPFLLLAGRPILTHAIASFEGFDDVAETIPIVAAEEAEDCLARVVEPYGLKKVRRVLIGGKERYDSVRVGLEAAEKPSQFVIVHDGVRPIVPAELIQTLLKEVKPALGIVVGVPIKETVKAVAKDGHVEETLDRRHLWTIQTPQIFGRKMLQEAYDEAYKHRSWGTDDASLVERAGGRVKVIQGSYANIKITTPEDLVCAEALLRARRAASGAGA